MPEYQLYMYGLQAMWVVFIFALGACVGSLINVLVYRLPLGLSVVTPPSRCPACETRLSWRDNIPIFGWIVLRGRCRYCRSAISPEYPLVELLVALLFAAFFVLWYIVPNNAVWLDVQWGAIKPEWARPDVFFGWPRDTWPIFIVLLALLGALVAMTIVDAKTFTIPLELPWFATAVALVFHVGYAAYLSSTGGRLPQTAFGTAWAIPLPGWNGRGLISPEVSSWWLGASFGGTLGLVIANVLLAARLIPRSFADYDEWEHRVRAEAKAQRANAPGVPAPMAEPRLDAESPVAIEPAATPASTAGDHAAVWRGLKAAALAAAVFAALAAAGAWLGPAMNLPKWSGLLAGALLAPFIYAVAARLMESSAHAHGNADADSTAAAAQPGIPSDGDELPPDMWIRYPHARRELLKEVLFLAPSILLAFIGGWLFQSWLSSRPVAPALWIMVAGGVLQGYLVAGAIVWGVRILGTLGFGKEAMGLGDVHLLAAVGACIGWVDAALAFPLAAVVGLYWVFVSVVRTGGTPRAMPFGPYLAAATVLVVLCKPLCERGLNWLLPPLLGQLPINLP
ncbi:MAG: A24 family peptidase [Phycisphaeraceae bacterium]|nr:A24 family peptidase [Phycisphaeraceae bacterium]